MKENQDLEQKGGLAEASKPEVEVKPGYDDLIDRVVAGRYRIIRKIGAGGMGVVYLAYQEGLGREVIIKVMRDMADGEAEGRIRFEREAKGLSKLEHQNIVTVYDFGCDEDLYFIAMEYVDGETLSRFMRRREGMSFATFAPIAMQILSAIAEAHRVGIIHRDLKPGNVMLCQRQGIPNFVKVLDFGLAKLVHSKQEVTKKSEIVGSASFMSPEQILGKGKIGKGVDVYALGILFFLMLSGRKPFEGEDEMSILYGHVHTPAPSLNEVLPPSHDVPHEVILLIERCLRKDPEERPRDAGEIIELLRNGVDTSSVLAMPGATPGEFTPFPLPRAGSGVMSQSGSMERSRPDLSGIENAPKKEGGGKKALIGVGVGILLAVGAGAFFLLGEKEEPAASLVAEVPMEEDESEEEDRSGVARGLRVAGLAALEAGDYDDAVTHFSRALQLGGAGNDVAELLQISRTLLDNSEARRLGADSDADSDSDSEASSAQARATQPAAARPAPVRSQAPVARAAPAPSQPRREVSASRSSGREDSSDAEEAATGMLLIASTPDGIAFQLNDDDGGITPARLSVPAGTHRITYFRDGNPIATRQITVEAGKLAVADAELRPDSSGAAENVAGSGTAEEERVEEERVEAESAPEESRLEASVVQPPPSGVITEKPPEEQPVLVGELLVESPNVYGEVWVNGRQVGFPPTVVRDLPVGPARVEIKIDGRTRRARTVRIEENRRVPVRM